MSAPTLRERLAALTADLVRFPTVATNPAAIAECLAWVRGWTTDRLPEARMREFVSNGSSSLLCWLGDAPPRVLLCGHLDVVPAASDDAFLAKRLPGNRLAGRGVADMKGPIAALLDLFTSAPQPGLGLLLTTDEEDGGMHGTGYVLGQLPWRPDVALLPDGGANMRLVAEQKGALRLRLTAEGTAAHGARPWLGVNALEQLYAGYRALLRAYPPPRAEDDWRVSIALTQVSDGGNAGNSIPAHAEATLDIRYPATGPDAFAVLLPDLQRRLRRYAISAEVTMHAPPFLLDTASPYVTHVQAAASRVTGGPLPLCREAGASDARFFAVAGVPTLIFQPVCSGWHGPDEQLDLTSLATFHALCAAFIHSALV
ncbi:MAG: hypothetical protein OJF49_004478 [Ktedonobacterales bacterium]|nr:MAG: hypothetical protein OJF49_004478 [Ktedonobacterales bacterium]